MADHAVHIIKKRVFIKLKPMETGARRSENKNKIVLASIEK